MGPRISAPHGQGHPRRWRVLGAVSGALSLVVIDNTVLSVALPSLATDLGATIAQQQAVVDAYVIVFAGLLIAAGTAADRWGRRRVLLCGLALLAVAATAAAAAWSVWWLVAMRALMGAGAAMVMPSTLAVLVGVFPEHERPRAFAVWGAVAAAALAAGPVLGGALVQAWSWPAVFAMNAPVALCAGLAVARVVPESRDPRRRPLDTVGAALTTSAMVGTVSAVIAAGERGPFTPAALAGAVLALASVTVLLRRHRAGRAAVADFVLYRNRRFAAGSAAAALLTFGTGSVLFVLTQYLQLGQGLDAARAGLAVLPLAAGTVMGSAAGGRAPAVIGSRACIVAGFTVAAAGLGVLALLEPESHYLTVAAGLGLAGVGTGFSSPATTSMVLGAVPAGRAATGSAMHDTHQQLGIALGVAVLGAVLGTAYRAALPEGVPRPAASSLAATLDHAAITGDAALADAARAAFAHAQSVSLAMSAVFALLGAAVAAALLRDPDPR
ncbi:MFS transporter [Marinactinospora rubrisoli]|uniref:MFS transporter n=1 Tax=Marinactinospora rubrisoli TaxID=2715399 RepID=A0ABW2KPC3_9ACTN